ncbi:MAG TPA: zinc-ribbon domain-containing protein, partial [Longimicrobiaceae bacterium]|nr:zinc-ribbon domain-containing protein [Longimicrobiaceae bacterium]
LTRTVPAMAPIPDRDGEIADDVTLPLPTDSPDAAEEVFRCERCGTEYEGVDACPVCGSLRVAAECPQDAGRPAEGRCVICGRLVCDRCRAGDHDAFLCEEHRTVPMIEGWAQVYSTHGELEAQLVRDNLAAEGIDAQIYSQKDHIYPVDLGELSIVRVMVPVWEYGAALEVIRNHMDTEGEVVFACPSCGEAYEPGAEVCTNCGAPLA